MSSEHYSRGLDIDRTPKRRRPSTPDVAEIDLILSSDEELEGRYRKASRLSQGLRIPPPTPEHRPRKGAAPPPPRCIDFDSSRSSTPDLEQLQDFFSDSGA